MLKLSILDQAPVPKGSSVREALLSSIELAKLADSLGYHRYWFAEHHNTNDLASVAPEILISHIIAHTSQIRVGSGGVLLSHYSPYKVAENFKLLEGLSPNRIDLGIGRSPGGDPRTEFALADGGARSREAFPRQVEDLLHFLSDEPPSNPRLQGLFATPRLSSKPEVWLLGSSSSSATYAAKLGTPFCFAHFINTSGGARVIQDYYRAFQPSSDCKEPKASVCVYVVCAETDAEAQRLASSLEYWLIKLAQGMGGIEGIPSVEEACAFNPIDWEIEEWNANRGKMIVGSPETVKAGLEYMANEYGTDEIMILTNLHDQEARLNSYRLIAEAFDLKSAQNF